MHLSKIKDIKTLNNLFETNQITCRIGVLGGRRFSIGKGKSFSLNQLLQKTVELSKKAPSEELDKALTGIKKLNQEGENKYSAASSCLKKLTDICRKLGGKFDKDLLGRLEEKSRLRKLNEKYSIEFSKIGTSKNLEELNKRTEELQTQLDKTIKKNEEDQKQLDNVKRENEESQNKLDELKTKKKVSQKKFNELQTKIDNNKKENEENQKKHDELKTKNQLSKKRLDEVAKDNKALEKELIELQTKPKIVAFDRKARKAADEPRL